MSDPTAVLNPPAVESVRYAVNFINTAVCELRFPTLLELEAAPPTKFQTKIRKDYPHYEAQIIEDLAGEQAAREHRYLFRSKDRHWTVSVKSFAISLETTKYLVFEDFFERFIRVLNNAKEMIDADFFTRIGLRYINWVPIEQGNPKGWIRDELIMPITGGVLGVATEFASRIHGSMTNGRFTIRHGLKEKDDKTPGGPAQYYLLDFDYFAENVEADAVQGLIRQFNRMNFSLFSWCLGEKAIKRLGPGRPKT